LSFTLLCKESVRAGVDWCCRVGGAGEPWPLENTQETKQGKYITTYFQDTHTQNYFKYTVIVKTNTMDM